MPVVWRILLARARQPLGLTWLLFARRHHGGADLAQSLSLDGWRFGEVIKKPAIVEVRIGVWLCTFAAAFLLSRLIAHTGARFEVLALAAFVGLFAFCVFISVSCGPVVRFDYDGLEVSSRSEGTHFVPWSDIHGYDHVSLAGQTHCSIDLGPRSPIASRYVYVARRTRTVGGRRG